MARQKGHLRYMPSTLNRQTLVDGIVGECADKFCLILESMADERPSIERRDVAAGQTAPAPEADCWEQAFNVSPAPLVWVATPRSSAVDIGHRVLVASGVDTAGESDALNTYGEILNQALSALGQFLTGQLEREVVTAQGSALPGPPPDLEWSPIQLRFQTGSVEPIWIAISGALVDLIVNSSQKTDQPDNHVSDALFDPAAGHLTAVAGASKTFDLLLDVALPVSISFGRTYLALKEVLKLTTGSIVELDRAVSEPVDVIVNNCVIARGEVVVIEGNYGVRIHQIASRYDRLRTGASATQVQHALTAN